MDFSKVNELQAKLKNMRPLNGAEGVYRGLPAHIMGAAHTPPQPYLVPVQMEQLIADYPQLKADKHILAAIL